LGIVPPIYDIYPPREGGGIPSIYGIYEGEGVYRVSAPHYIRHIYNLQ